jgi:hypothetical protein
MRYYLSICLEGLRKAIKTSVRGAGVPEQNSNWALPECESRELPLHQTAPCCVDFDTNKCISETLISKRVLSLGGDVVYYNRSSPTCRRNVLPPPSGSKSRPS